MMKEINKIKVVSKIRSSKKKIFIVFANGEVTEISKTDKTLAFDISDILKMPNSNVLFFSKKNNKIILANDTGTEILIEVYGEFLSSSVKFYQDGIIVTELISGNKASFYIDENLHKTELNYKPYCIIGDKFYNYNKHVFAAKNFDGSDLWELNLDSINETIDITANSSPFGNGIKVFIPVSNGNLLSLNTKTGKINWTFNSFRTGGFTINENIIYKNDGLSIQKIDTQSGQLLQTKEFAADSRISKFYSTGPTWIFDNMIFMISVSEGEICVLNANDLSVIDYGKIESAAGIPNSKDSLIYLENKIYVLDIEGTLHVLEMT